MVLLSQIFLIIFNKKSSIQPQIFQSPAPNQLNKSPEITNQSARDKKNGNSKKSNAERRGQSQGLYQREFSFVRVRGRMFMF